MNAAETEYWVDQLFPGEMSRYEIAPGVGGGDDNKPLPQGLRVGVCSVDDRLDVSCTLDLSRCDCGLRTAKGEEVRVEFFTVAARSQESETPVLQAVPAPPPLSAFLVTTAAAMVVSGRTSTADIAEPWTPTPGTLLPDAVSLGIQAATEAGVPCPPQRTVSHYVVAVPHVWADGVPQVIEPPGEVSLHEEDSGPLPGTRLALGRITTVAQLIPLSDAEFAHAQREGADAVLQALAAAGADPRDLCRASVL